MLVIQAVINMGVAVGVFPVTGQPLPLISRGGTSTFMNCAYLGIMLSVSRSARQIENEIESPQLELAEEPYPERQVEDIETPESTNDTTSIYQV